MSIEAKRPPVVVVVGHVDHGKTSLLDFIRKTNVVAKEAGGITQSVGAYEIVHKDKNQESHKITFIDTPGHEAFSKMRVRGTHIADIGILVVAADEGVKPQTKEAIKVLIDSKTPFVVAITKIDKPGADVNRVKNELMANNVLLEGYGGGISHQGVSSKTGEGINELLDLIILTSDVEELKYGEETKGSGFILEARMDNQRGNTVTAILKNGKLKKGDLIATPSAKGKIKILENFLGNTAPELFPSSPAIILGFDELPQIGEKFTAGNLSEKELSDVISFKAGARGKTLKETGEKEENIVRVILKADVAGSLEALSDILKNMPLEGGKKLEIVDNSVGNITDGDIKDAIATNAVVVGFKVKAIKAAENLARDHSIIIIINEIIYKLVENIQEISVKISEKQVGNELEILAVFNVGTNKQTVGGKVTRGQIKNKSRLDIQRAGEVIGSGRVISLQQNKKDIFVVNEGNECGLIFESDVKIEVGDRLLNK